MKKVIKNIIKGAIFGFLSAYIIIFMFYLILSFLNWDLSYIIEFKDILGNSYVLRVSLLFGILGASSGYVIQDKKETK